MAPPRSRPQGGGGSKADRIAIRGPVYEASMTRSRYIIGIDLGTTNSAVAYVDTKGRERPSADIKPFDVPQLVAAGETAPRPMLPSFFYLPGPHELPPGSGDTPWAEGSDRIVGEFARIQGAARPGPSGLEREELAVPSRRRSRGRHPPVGRPERGAAGLARRCVGRVFTAYPRRLGRDVRPRRPREPLRASGGRPDRPRLVRRGRARADGRGGQASGLSQDDAPGRAAGGVLLLDRHPSRCLAAARSAPGN